MSIFRYKPKEIVDQKPKEIVTGRIMTGVNLNS